MSQRGLAPILTVLLITVITLGAGFFIYQNINKTIIPQQTACTQEAKICPGGTSVGRSGPKCEFTPCPTSQESSSSADMTNWRTYTNAKFGFSFKYPPNLYPKGDELGAGFWDEKDVNKKTNELILSNGNIPLPKFNVFANDIGMDFNKLYATPNNTVIPGETAGPGEKVIKIKNLTLDNQKAAQYETVSSNTDELWTLVKQNDIFIEIYIQYKDELEQFKPTYNQILSTFKFTQ